MKSKFIYLASLFLIVCTISTYGQTQKPTDPTWEELAKSYSCPDWYSQGKFGIWTHWGAQAKPALGGGWYGKHMYMEDVGTQTWGEDAYEYHLKTYGHPSEMGYKEVLNSWKAEDLNTDELMVYFKDMGARFFVALANHHDHFDNFDSSHHPWNSVNIGPKKDLIGEFRASAKKYDLPFGVSSHDDRYFRWFKTAFGSDKSGPKKGIPYDGHHTVEDGKGLWWEGLDPADLYGLPSEKRTAEWEEKQKVTWQKRHLELITKYKPDMLWFDGYGFPYGDYGKEVSRQFYLQNRDEEGNINAVLSGKKIPGNGHIEDVERGVLLNTSIKPWQSIVNIASWFHNESSPLRQNGYTLTQILADVVSKNGTLLLNIELTPEGVLPLQQKECLDQVGAWLKLNGEAIYETKPWKVFGDGDGASVVINPDETDLEALKKGGGEHFNLRTVASKAYPRNEVRFTTKGEDLYIILMNPRTGLFWNLEMPSLAKNATTAPEKKIGSVQLIGGGTKRIGGTKNIEFKQTKESLSIAIPKSLNTYFPVVFKLEGVL